MNRIRLVFVTRRFWPLLGGAEKAMSNLACELVRMGHRATILTARWEKRWPKEFAHRGVSVVRLDQPKRRGWGTIRYMRNLSRWLRAHRQEYDAVVVSQLKHDAYAAIGALAGTDKPVILRAPRGGENGDCQWQRKSRFGDRIAARCRQAAAIAVPNPAIGGELIDALYPTELIHVIEDGIEVAAGWSPGSRDLARASLAEAHCLFEVQAGTPLVVYAGLLHEVGGVFDLVDAWPTIMRRWPSARIWMLGDGPDAQKLWERIKRHELENNVILPGSFDEMDDVLRAADLYVAPNRDEDNSLALLEAMAIGVPVIASNTPGHRHVIEHRKNGWLVPPGEVNELADAIVRVLEDNPSGRRMAENAREIVNNQFVLAHTARQYAELFENLLAKSTLSNFSP